MESAFSGAKNFTINAVDTPDLSLVTNMKMMFEGAKSFNADISAWDISNITDMSNMFYYAESFNQDLSSWKVDKVIKCENFAIDTTSWVLPKPNFTNCTPKKEIQKKKYKKRKHLLYFLIFKTV